MKKISLVAIILLACTPSVDAADPRTLTHIEPAAAIEVLDLDSGIGDVMITAREGIDDIAIEVQLTPRRGGFFSSKRQAEQAVEAAYLHAVSKGHRLVLRIDPPADEDRRFEEQWTIEIPAHIKLTLDHGVGDVVILGNAAGLEIDSGVGDVDVQALKGDITIDLGVGTAVVRAPASAYASAEGAGGVGDARLTVLDKRIEGGGFVGHSATWTGDGRHHIEVSVGVGDAVITLD
jgi:hypothetical protein